MHGVRQGLCIARMHLCDAWKNSALPSLRIGQQSSRDWVPVDFKADPDPDKIVTRSGSSLKEGFTSKYKLL